MDQRQIAALLNALALGQGPRPAFGRVLEEALRIGAFDRSTVASSCR